MAIYQFLTYIIPKKSIIQKFGEVPTELEIKHAEWEKFWNNFTGDIDDDIEPEFEDAKTIKWWKNKRIKIQELRAKIDEIIPRSSWSDNSWEIKTSKIDHDLSIDWNEKGNYIEEFQFRTDLGDTSLIFLNKMLKLCLENEWILMDEKGRLCEPKIEDLIKLIKGSNPDKFLKNPIGFLDSLSEKE